MRLAFGYWVVLLPAVRFLTNYDSHLYTIEIRRATTTRSPPSCSSRWRLVFELPIFVLALVRLGVLSTDVLRRNRKAGYLIMFVIAVVLPTADPVSLVLETIPLLILYELSIWLAVFMERRWKRGGAAGLASAREPPRLPEDRAPCPPRGHSRPETLLAIARRNDYALPADTVEGLRELYEFRDFEHFIEIWVLTTNALRDETTSVRSSSTTRRRLPRTARSTSRPSSPAERVRRGIAWDDIFAGYCDGAEEARELHAVEIRLTPDIVRGFPLDESEPVVRYSRSTRTGAWSPSASGAGSQYPPEPYGEVFELAKAEGLGSVPHAGEARPASIRGALADVAGGSDPTRLPRRRGPRARGRARGPRHRPGRLADLQREDRRRQDARRASAAEARGGGRALLDLDRRSRHVRHRSHPGLRRRALTRSRSAIGFEADVEGALCDEGTRNDFGIGRDFDWAQLTRAELV